MISIFLTCLPLVFPVLVTGGLRFLLAGCESHVSLSRQLGFSLQPILDLVVVFTPAPLVQLVGTVANPLLKVDSGFSAICVCGFCLGSFRGNFHSISRSISVEIKSLYKSSLHSQAALDLSTAASAAIWPQPF
jgi:hypothetical protein